MVLNNCTIHLVCLSDYSQDTFSQQPVDLYLPCVGSIQGSKCRPLFTMCW